MENYSDRIRRGEYRRKGARFTERDLHRMREQARALLHLEETGWLPESDKQATLNLNGGGGGRKWGQKGVFRAN